MSRFIKQIFLGLLSVCTIGSFCESLVFNSKGRMSSMTYDNRQCQVMSTLVNINSDETIFHHLLLVLISVVKVVTLLMIHILEFAFQIK